MRPLTGNPHGLSQIRLNERTALPLRLVHAVHGLRLPASSLLGCLLVAAARRRLQLTPPSDRRRGSTSSSDRAFEVVCPRSAQGGRRRES